MKPYIDDLRKLKIKKVTDFKILFKYDDKEYLLINHDEYDPGLCLYEREKVRQDRYVLKFISSVPNTRVHSLIKDMSKVAVKNITYSNINLDFFVSSLTLLGIIDSLYTPVANKLNEEIDKLYDEIDSLYDKITELNNNYYNSKLYKSAYFNRIKTNAAERIKPAPLGSYCDKFKAKYGDTHKDYGGILVDLFGLPCNTLFRCTNGCWIGLICFDKHGNKAVGTETNLGFNEIKITESNKDLYVEIMRTEKNNDYINKLIKLQNNMEE